MARTGAGNGGAPPDNVTALRGLRVLDCSRGVAGAAASMFFADFGADVVRIEVPGDDAGRSTDPGFAVWDRGKSRQVIDLDDPLGVAEMERLLAEADVCVVSASDDALAGTPLDPESVCAANPTLVYLHVPAYLASTPWAGEAASESLLVARTGIGLRQASVDEVPVESVYDHVVTVHGVWAAAAAMAALVERERSGLGQRVTVGGLHAALVAAAAAFNFDADLPEVSGRRAGGSGGPIPFYRTYACADGEWLFLAALTPRFTELAFAALGLPDLNDDPRLEGTGRAGMLTPAHASWVIDVIAEVFRSQTRAVWLERLGAAGCPCGPLLDRDDWLDHPQLAAIGMRVEVDDPERGPVVQPGNPIVLTASPHPVRIPRRSDGPGNGGGGRGPLDGVRVLDLGAIIAGPFAGSLLAELGADVIKVEPLGGDSFRGPGFAAYNKGQRSIALDLRSAEGHAFLLDLVRTADVVIDNYRPGVVERLRIRYEDLVEVNPTIITLSVTGFGEGGPMGNEAGFDPVLQAMSGMMRAQGGIDDPVFFTVPVNDVTAAASGALAVGLALFHRERTGEGQRTWTSLAAMSALLQAGQIVRFEGRPPARQGATDFAGPADDDRYHRVADGWIRVCGATAEASWSQRTRADVIAELTARGIPAVAALTAREIVEHPIEAAAGAFHRDPRPGRERFWTVQRQARFSRTERNDTLVAPRLDEHAAEIRADVERRIRALRDQQKP